MTGVVAGASLRSVCVLAALTASLSAQSPLESTANRYCVTCHNDKLRTAGLSLSAAGSAQPEILEKVLQKLRSAEMPPAGMPAPDAITRLSVIRSLETQLDRTAAEHPNPGAPGIHRLNRAEYRNAVRDLLWLDMEGSMDYSASLPPDDSGYGFDNIADVLTVSPLHMEKYLASARRIARLAVGTLKPSISSEKITAPPGTANDSIDALPPRERGAILFRRYFPFDAEYSFLLRVRGNPAPGLPPAKLDLRVDGRRVKLFDAAINTAEANQGTRNIELRLNLPAGDHVVGAAFLTESVKVEGGPAQTPSSNGLAVDYVTVGGPYNPSGPGNTESRRRIFICRPEPGQPEEICARRILSSLARRAYRRSVNATDIAPLLKLFASGRDDGSSFDSGIELALSGILVSPGFLFRTENSPPGRVTKIGDLELASRLSFFLWSSIPDEELLRIAEAGKLRDPATLTQQVRRMIADPKSQSFEDNFAGQWLHLRNVAAWKPDTKKYPQFDEALRNAFERESGLFFSNIMREDRSVLEFIDAGYTFLNERLARFYGVPGVKGSYFRRVDLKSDALVNEHRGGVLSQGAILLVTSYPTRTSPVLRGKWILENILGSPPPPPPPNVPPLADNASDSAHSLREQLEKHRADRACASCHARLDPLGFSLEQYDAIGRFRTKEDGADGAPIEASGALPDGTAVNGPEGLKKVVLDRRDDFVECLTAKMLTYALGRGLEYYDQPAVRAIRRQAASEDYRFSSIVLGIVNSVPFQMRKQSE
jgi:hypothetical protein